MNRTKLISMTMPVGELEELSPEELTAFVARVSNPANQMNNETAPRLLSYCLKNQHWSVFEHVSVSFEIKTSRAIAAQILRHRSFVFQEFSQRYAEAVEIEKYPARRQDVKNRQNSIDDLSQDVQEWFLQVQENIAQLSMKWYREALEKHVAKEQARFLLPLATSTTLYMTGNLRSWITYLDLRTEKGTQLEHREIAEEIKATLCDKFPTIAKAKGWIPDTP